MADLSTLQLGTPSAVVNVRRRLMELGIDDDASVHHLAADESSLRSVAAEVLGNGFGNEAWFALLHVWRSSAFQGRRWVESQSRRLSAPPTPPAAAAVPPRPTFPPEPASLPLVTPASAAARCAATFVVLSSGG